MKNLKIKKNVLNLKNTRETIGGKVVPLGHTGAKALTKRISCNTWYLMFVLFSTNSSNNWTQRLIEFCNLWSFSQWISSLISLIVLYWITGYYYNKWLSNRGGWLSWKIRIYLILSDLLINLVLGMYYMKYRHTFIGEVLVHCPIACSPLIFFMELMCFYFYYRYFKNSNPSQKDKNS